VSAFHTGDGGYLLQACHARLCSLERRFLTTNDNQPDDSLFPEEQAQNLIQHIRGNFETDLKLSLENLDPSHLVKNVFELAHKANAAHKFLKVAVDEKELANARMSLFKFTRDLLSRSLKLLGLEPLEKM